MLWVPNTLIMPGYSDYHIARLTEFRGGIEKALASSRTLQEAAQSFAEMLYEELEASTVLARVFTTVRFGALPGPDKQFVKRVATERGCRDELEDQTVVVSLLGTRGRQPSWNHRYQSGSRLGIPLSSTSFIKTIPMLARLLNAADTGVRWIEKQQTRIVAKSFGQMAQLLYVDDAKAAVTDDGFKIVANQDFVDRFDVRTVLGLGGVYLNGSYVSVLLFTNELIPQQKAEKFLTLIHSFKSTTTNLVMNGKIFEP
jgi:hypothetical protein